MNIFTSECANLLPKLASNFISWKLGALKPLIPSGPVFQRYGKKVYISQLVQAPHLHFSTGQFTTCTSHFGKSWLQIWCSRHQTSVKTSLLLMVDCRDKLRICIDLFWVLCTIRTSARICFEQSIGKYQRRSQLVRCWQSIMPLGSWKSEQNIFSPIWGSTTCRPLLQESMIEILSVVGRLACPHKQQLVTRLPRLLGLA